MTSEILKYPIVVCVKEKHVLQNIKSTKIKSYEIKPLAFHSVLKVQFHFKNELSLLTQQEERHII